MFEPVRGGTRGGQAEFKWADVSADKDRENYLGHSINAPTGRWQKNKDVHWYNRDQTADEAAEKAEEIRKIKELEAEALAAALGYEPTKPGPKPASGTSSGANAVPVASTSAVGHNYTALDPDAAARKAEKEARRAAKDARKEEKRTKKEIKRLKKGAHDAAELDDRPRRRSSRSRSPVRRIADRERSRSRSRSPGRTRRHPDAREEERQGAGYDERERERERERHRMQWERSTQRERPRDYRDRDRRRW